MTRRFFLAHRKAADDDELDQLVTALSRLCDRFAKGQAFDLILGRTYFEARFKACGSWESWTSEVATGVDYLTRRPIFDCIFVPAAPIGAGTAAIVRKALGSRPIFAFTLTGEWAPVSGVRQVDGTDWQEGNRLVCAKPLAL